MAVMVFLRGVALGLGGGWNENGGFVFRACQTWAVLGARGVLSI